MSSRLAIAIGGGLVALVVIAQLFGAAPKYSALIASAFVLVALVVMNRRARRRAGAFHASNKEGLAALARGDFTAARTAWERWIERPATPRMAALARHNLAWTMIREGDFERAIAMLEANEARHLPALDAVGLAATSAADRALAYGLGGDLKSAQSWLDRAQERLLRATVPTAGALALAGSVVHCRAGRITEATKLLEDQWTELEATTTGDVLRPLRVVRAFVQATGPRSGGVAEAALPTLRPAYPSEFAFLGVAWPRMSTFLASHELVPANP
jgi:tetratricopeptide (TPR) repeat protein